MIRAVCLSLALVAVLVWPTASGAATPDSSRSEELGLSWDGRNWSDTLPGSLFDPRIRWVPGDVRTEEFHVRNQADESGDLTISVAATDPDSLLRDEDIVLAARVDRGAWVRFENTAGWFRLQRSELAAGGQNRVQVRASFDPGSGNESQADRLSLRFLVTLSDARAGGNDEEPPDEGGNGWLPDTGAPALGWLLVMAGVAIGTGLALVRRGRREELDHGSTQ